MCHGVRVLRHRGCYIKESIHCVLRMTHAYTIKQRDCHVLFTCVVFLIACVKNGDTTCSAGQYIQSSTPRIYLADFSYMILTYNPSTTSFTSIAQFNYKTNAALWATYDGLYLWRIGTSGFLMGRVDLTTSTYANTINTDYSGLLSQYTPYSVYGSLDNTVLYFFAKSTGAWDKWNPATDAYSTFIQLPLLTHASYPAGITSFMMLLPDNAHRLISYGPNIRISDLQGTGLSIVMGSGTPQCISNPGAGLSGNFGVLTTIAMFNSNTHFIVYDDFCKNLYKVSLGTYQPTLITSVSAYFPWKSIVLTPDDSTVLWTAYEGGFAALPFPILSLDLQTLVVSQYSYQLTFTNYIPSRKGQAYFLTARNLETCGNCNISQYCPAGSSQATTCAAGYYCVTPSSSQVPCDLGQYCPAGSSQAVLCAAGYYCSTPSSSLIPCPAGSYCAAGSTQAQACAAGRYCPSGSSVAVSCAAGYYCSTPSSSQTPCPAGSYCAAGSTQAQACTSGQYCPSGSSAAVSCAAGYYCSSPSAIQTQCVSRQYCPAGTTLAAPCPLGSFCSTPANQTVCVAGQYCPSGSSLAVACAPKNYCPDPSTQIACSSYAYCPSGATSPITCPAGSYCTPTTSNNGVCSTSLQKGYLFDSKATAVATYDLSTHTVTKICSRFDSVCSAMNTVVDMYCTADGTKLYMIDYANRVLKLSLTGTLSLSLISSSLQYIRKIGMTRDEKFFFLYDDTAGTYKWYTKDVTTGAEVLYMSNFAFT